MRSVHAVPLVALVLSLVSQVSFSQQSPFQDYDTNRDNRISQHEFQNQIRTNQSFEGADRNQDRRIDESEFGEVGIEGDYGLWDTNDDNYVDENEYYGGTFNQYDANNDGYWDNNDWDTADSDGWFDF